MLNSDDVFTPASLYRLKKIVRAKHPLVIWIGAGASLWAGLPSWRESARSMRRTFAKAVPTFQDEVAKSLLDSNEYPELFQLCKDTDQALYNRTLLDQLKSPASGAVYSQLIDGLKSISPLQIVTTNVDLSLEQCLGPIDVVERTDLERCSEMILPPQNVSLSKLL
jgi:NAD-dependent SIR2 family protein deacetylase